MGDCGRASVFGGASGGGGGRGFGSWRLTVVLRASCGCKTGGLHVGHGFNGVRHGSRAGHPRSKAASYVSYTAPMPPVWVPPAHRSFDEWSDEPARITYGLKSLDFPASFGAAEQLAEKVRSEGAV